MYTSSMYHLYVSHHLRPLFWGHSRHNGATCSAKRKSTRANSPPGASSAEAWPETMGDHGKTMGWWWMVVNDDWTAWKKWWKTKKKIWMLNDVHGFCWWDVIGCWWDEIGDLMLILMGYDGIFGRFVPFDIHIMRNDGMKWRCTVLNYG